jgi:hypothetical protein
MPKQCPQCLQIYGTQVKFCSRDGAVLIDADAITQPATSSVTDQLATRIGATPRKLRWIVIVVVLCVVAVGATAGYLWLRDHLQSRVGVSLEGISLSSRTSPGQGSERPSLLGRIVDLAKVAIGSSDLAARVKINNSTAFSGALKSATYTIVAGDKELGRGVWNSGGLPLKFNAGEQFDLDLPFRLDGRNTVGSLLDAVTGKPIPLELRGEMDVQVYAMTFTIPFRAHLVTPQSQQ